ncbi:hypothetical protein [Pedobacter sp. SYSU D00535]|uniref:hypothetical protein n=1 Tax=Pedobacter sp. SYSU D00535 TaxID=2810308 RepID=UPI001A95FA68|nr:hypothetical protein [Pedobacter sp. SYSU D00535]
MISETSSFKSVNVYLALDRNSVEEYFNRNDPSPMYRRQLSVKFEDYIKKCVLEAKEDDLVIFKLYSSSDKEQQYAEPLMYAIKRHFSERKTEEIRAFTKFKRHNGGIIAVNLLVVALSNFLLPLIISEKVAYETGVKHLLEVLWFVIFYHPLGELLFNWKPHVQKIELMEKLTNVEYLIVEKEKKRQIIYD